MSHVCEFSSQLFGGFQCHVDLANVESMDEIIILAISQLRAVLQTHKFRELVSKIDKAKWHVHSHTFPDVLTHENDTIWICDHDTSEKKLQ